jgi:O-antigen/teichoic acid export membrane protein
LAVTLVPVLIANIYSFVIAGACIDVSRGEVKKLKLNVLGQFSEGRSIFFNSILASLITTAWPLLLSFSLTRAELGAYGIADKIVRGLMTFVTPLPAFILASNRVAGVFAIAGLVLKHRLYRIFLLVVLLAPVALMVLPSAIYQMLLGDAVIEHRMVLNVYVVGFLFYIGDLILYTYMIVARRDALYAPIVVVSFVLSFAVGYVFEVNIYTPVIYEALVALMLMLAILKINTRGVLSNK